jgi:putative molybdopterin biosynthesis protein
MTDSQHLKNVYLHDIPLEKAWATLIESLESAGLWKPLQSEEVPLDEALGRVTAEPVWAHLSSPHYHAAAMDGFALRAVDTSGASDRTPLTLQVNLDAVYVDTGNPMPEWADAVVPIEYVEPVEETGERAIRIRAAVAPWTHVRAMGEDMVATELVVPAGHELRPVDLGAIAGSGHHWIQVWRRPRVAIIPTGTELVPIGSEVEAGETIEYNSLVLAAQVETWGGQATRFPSLPDDFERIRESVSEATVDHDLVLVNAGSSAGSEDYTAKVVESLGKLLVHGVAVRPGHPVVLGVVNRTPEKSDQPPALVPVIGVPGYPVSAALTGEIFVEPLLARWLGRPPHKLQTIEATLTRKVRSSLGDDEYLRVTVGRVGERMITAPLSRGAGIITSLVRADGIVLIPAGVQGLQTGETVTVHLYRSLADVEQTILVLGSHDLTIDLMAQFLSQHGSRLSSANLGSLGGLVALRRGEAHLAGSHLLDPASGEYNLSYIEKYLPDVPVIVMGYVKREQGLIVSPGNPKGLTGLADLVKDGVSFINRQQGAGTRILLDYHLGELGLDPKDIIGYNREEYTHLAVAAAVSSGAVDCGLGIRAAAEALKLSFIPLYNERFDLVIPLEHYENPKLAPLLELLHDAEFRRSVDALAGYDTSPMGEIIAEMR